MQRNKGQFTSSKKSDGAYGWGGGQDSGQDDIQQETTCVLQSFGIYWFLYHAVLSEILVELWEQEIKSWKGKIIVPNITFLCFFFLSPFGLLLL